jgi:hypothetical protein
MQISCIVMSIKIQGLCCDVTLRNPRGDLCLFIFWYLCVLNRPCKGVLFLWTFVRYFRDGWPLEPVPVHNTSAPPLWARPRPPLRLGGGQVLRPLAPVPAGIRSFLSPKISISSNIVKYVVRSLNFIWASSVRLYSLAETPQPSPPPPTPRIWAHVRELYWSAKIDDVSLWPPE